MATRCRIGIKEKGFIRHIYSHWDGYPEYVGELLMNHYETSEKAKALINLGNISILRRFIGKKHEAGAISKRKQWTESYGRDFDYKGDEPKKSKNIALFLDVTKKMWGEYAYLFQNGEWYYKDTYKDGDFAPLSDYFKNKPKDTQETELPF
jgi:hypothetical protein